MNSEKINKINKWLVVAFLIMQPILELIITLFKNDRFTIAGMSIGTIIRYGLLAIIIILAVLSNLKRKSTKLFIGTVVIYGIYMIVHFLNNRNFDAVILGTSMSKGFITSMMYISKYIIPICIVYLVYVLNFGYKELKISVITTVLIVSLIIIITNMLGIDFVAYSFENNTKVAANIFKWFDSSYQYSDWRLLTSRGWFSSGNELSAFFVLLLPITFYVAFNEKKKIYFIVPFVQMIAMLLVGTRVSVYGAILMFVASVVVFIADSIINKKRIVKSTIIVTLIISVVYGIFFAYSPFMNRIKVGEGAVNSFIDEKNDKNSEKKVELTADDNTPERIFIKEKYQEESIPYDMIDRVYSYLEHSDFWVHIIKDVNIKDRSNARKLKTLILADIEENKSGNLDKVVGIGEVPIYPECDYITQYYYVGVIGIIIFLLPFILVFILLGCNEFIRIFDKKFNYLRVVYLISLAMIFATAYSAGHVLETVFINSFIGLIAGMCMQEILKRKRENISDSGLERYITKMYSNTKKEFIDELDKKVENNEKSFIVTANPETLMIAQNDSNFSKCLLDENTIIVPDGIGILKGANLFGDKIEETITGVELSKELFRIANEKSKSIYLFGASDEVISRLVEMIKLNYSNIQILGYDNGYVEDRQAVFEKIKKLKPDIVLVALGIPYQELMIYNNLNYFEKGIFMGVGGSFDVLSGSKKRAPKFFVKSHLEWLYRITKEPKRLKRFFKSNVKYVFKIIQER